MWMFLIYKRADQNTSYLFDEFFGRRASKIKTSTHNEYKQRDELKTKTNLDVQ